MKTRAVSPTRATPARQWKPMMDAAYAGEVERMRTLLARGADPNIQSSTSHRYRPLHRAIERKKSVPRSERHEKVVQRLLDAGADPRLRAAHGHHTVLQLAAIDSPRFVPLLIDYFRPLDLLHAAVLCDEKRVATLLKKRPDAAMAVDENQWSTLHCCAASALPLADSRWAGAQQRIARMLLAAGADPTVRTTAGKTAVQIAQKPSIRTLLTRLSARRKV